MMKKLLFGCLVFILLAGLFFYLSDRRREEGNRKNTTTYLITDFNGKRLNNVSIHVANDSNNQCVKAPCPSSEVWSGETNDYGLLDVPKEYNSPSITMYTVSDGIGSSVEFEEQFVSVKAD